MTTAEHAQSARTGTCPTPDELKQYLAGWSDDSQAEQLERHLELCPICEAAIQQMETRPDTLLQSLQSTVAAPVASPVARSVSDRDSAAPDSEASSPPENDSSINAALAKAKQLMDAPVETAADKARTAWLPMQRELGMYELIKPLGRGGMGAVYLASHKQLKKQVAIKLLPILSAEDSDVRARFDREIRVVGKLNHPSIVAATDAGEIDGTQFLVMEYVPGLDLSRLARLMGRLPVADACELICQAALGLSCAHAEGVVHRDVKPSNLMLDESGRIRILDFGLAQLSVWDEASVDLTTVGQLMGTLDYMAPEQAEVSGGVDYRADLYALGATLFRLLCGRPPLAAAPNQSPFEKLRLLANHQPPKLSTLCPEAPEELVKLVASLLSRNPSDRPASAAHVAEQLAPFAEGSKLVDLLQQAKEKAARSPELLKKSAFADLPQFGSLAPAEPAPLPTSFEGGRFKILRRLLLAASLPILIIAGILIKLETSKGQLVIESDVDNVSVKLLKDGKPVDGIQVSHGTTSTRLNADNYEITIDGPSDGLVIDNDKFTLKNGETVVARVRRDDDSSASNKVHASANQFDAQRLQAVAKKLLTLSESLNTTVLEWIGADGESEVKVAAEDFRDQARRLERFRELDLTLVDLQYKSKMLYQNWKTVYKDLAKCRTSQRKQLSEIAGDIGETLAELHRLVPSVPKLGTAQPNETWQSVLEQPSSSSSIPLADGFEGDSLEKNEPSAPAVQDGDTRLASHFAMRQKLQELDVELQLQVKRLGSRHPRVKELQEEITIRQQYLENALIEADRARAATEIDEPLYDGKPLEHWLDMLSREKSAAGLKMALDACHAFLMEETSKVITERLLKVLPRLDGNLQIGGGYQENLDVNAFSLLYRANPGAQYYSLWKQEIEHADKQWKDRLWLQAQRELHGNVEVVATVEPVIHWAEELWASSSELEKQDPGDTLKMADLLLQIVATRPASDDDVFVQRVLAILRSCPRLDAGWWLSQPLVVYRTDSEDTNRWPLPIKAEITRVAIDALPKDDTSPSLVAQACMILSNGAELSPEQRTSVLESVARRLTAACVTPDILTGMVSTSETFGPFTVPNLIAESPLSVVQVQIHVEAREQSSMVLELLDLVAKLKATADVQPQLDLVMKETQDTLEIVHSQIQQLPESQKRLPGGFGRGPGNPLSLALGWPDLTKMDGRFGPPDSGPDKFKLLWGTHLPSKRDWLEYLILLHPAMQDTVADALEKLK